MNKLTVQGVQSNVRSITSDEYASFVPVKDNFIHTFLASRLGFGYFDI